MPIDLDDSIAGLNSCPFRRRSGRRCNYDDPSIAHVDLYPNARIIAGGTLCKLSELVRREERRVGILDLLQHLIEGHFVHGPRADRIDIVTVEVRKDFVKKPCCFSFRGDGAGTCPALEEPSSRDEREHEQHRDRNRTRAKSGIDIEHQCLVSLSVPNCSGISSARTAITRL